MAKNLKIQIILSLCLLFLGGNLIGQGLWELTSPSKTSEKASELIEYVNEYQLAKVEFDAIKNKLSNAPDEFSGKKNFIIELPLPDGSLESFYAYYSPIMQEGLQAKFPEMRNYKVVSLDRKSKGRIGITYTGFHGSINTEKGRFYIDKFSETSKNLYASYYTKDYGKSSEASLACGVSAEDNRKFLENIDFDNANIKSKKIKTRTPEGEVVLRTYRCAIGCTGEFGNNKGGTVESVMSAINQSIDKVNEIFESEVAIRMILIDENDELLYFDASTDPYESGLEGRELVGENTSILANKIGLDKFDIGHVYTMGCTDGVGGIAALGSVCNVNKGNGVTCHFSSNIDYIAVDITCHEMGHQFAAPHTFNHCDGENENSSTAYEPGSGHTIMSYAGGCGPSKNVSSFTYPYYHSNSLELMFNFSREGVASTCGTSIEIDNTHPVIELDYVDGFSIPIETPFILDGKATDAENDFLTYSWEEFDLGPVTFPGQPVLDAPQFVSEVPNETSERYLPALDKIVTNTSDNREVLPFYDKDMTWRLTVRDNNSEGGSFEFKEVQFFSVEEAGPFLVDYPNNSETFEGGKKYTIEWDVANTDGTAVNCQYVDILLSVDGGYTYPYTLQAYTPNDGAQEVIFPDDPGNFNRIMVRASTNIFFDISNANSQITPATQPGYSAVAVPGYQEICLPEVTTIQINTLQFAGFDEDINFEVIGETPPGAVVEFSSSTVAPGESVNLIIDGTNIVESGIYEFNIRGIAGLDTVFTSATVQLTSNDFSDLAVQSPAKGNSGVGSVPTFTWVEDLDADSYIIEISDNPDFTNGQINIIENGITENSYTIEEPLFKNTVYYWRVTGINKCGTGFTTDLSTFATESLSCGSFSENAVPVNLPSSLQTTTELKTVIVSNGQVSDVNISKLQGTHTNFKELIATLVSPSGTEVVLFDKRCAGSTTFDAVFDSESPTEIECPLNGKQYAPEGDLSVFNGEDLLGTWTLKIEDTAAGNGGKVNQYVLQVCSNAALSPPSLERNKVLLIGPDQQKVITRGNLLVEDANNDPDELVYTLVKVPEYGELFTSEGPLQVGDIFTQYSIDNNYIVYRSFDDQSPLNDSFEFVVDDTEGGWIDISTFNIEIDVLNEVNNSAEFAYDVVVYPNPTSDIININVIDKISEDVQVDVMDVVGRKLKSTNYDSTLNITEDLSSYTTGTYFIQVRIANSSKVFKINLQR